MLVVPDAYECVFPWRKKGVGGALDIVRVRSSITPLTGARVFDNLHPSAYSTTATTTTTTATAASTTAKTATRFDEFSRAVRARMLQDLRLLPVNDPSTHVVERHNVSVYTSPPASATEAGEILLVYSPTTSSLIPPLLSATDGDETPLQRLEFVSFTLLPLP